MREELKKYPLFSESELFKEIAGRDQYYVNEASLKEFLVSYSP